MPDKNELAWAAGFFDGEGCTMFTAQHRLRMVVNQTNRETLERFQGAVGVGVINGPYQDRTNRQPHWMWQATGQAVIDAGSLLFDFLCDPKQEQMLVAIAKRQAFEELVSSSGNIGRLRRVS